MAVLVLVMMIIGVSGMEVFVIVLIVGVMVIVSMLMWMLVPPMVGSSLCAMATPEHIDLCRRNPATINPAHMKLRPNVERRHGALQKFRTDAGIEERAYSH